MNRTSLVITRNQPTVSQFSPNFVYQLIEEINLLRSNPKGYVSIIQQQQYVQKYGMPDIQETVSYLNNVQSCGTPMVPNVYLSRMAQRWVQEQGATSATGHGDLGARLQRENIPMTRPGNYAISENIAYGIVSPRDIVVAWVIDKGIEGKGHRVNLFRCDLTEIGVGYGSHASYGVMVVNDYGSGFQNATVGRARRIFLS